MDNTIPRDDIYVTVVNNYADNIAAVIEQAWLQHHINQYEYRELIAVKVRDARRMAEDFDGWCIADCRWEFGDGPLLGEQTWRALDGLQQAKVDCLEVFCWEAALRGPMPLDEAASAAERFFG